MQKQDSVLLKHIDANTLKEINSLVTNFKDIIFILRYKYHVHEQQARYRTSIDDLESRIESAESAERVKLNKQLSKLQDQEKELQEYEERIHHLVDQMISIDLDDGVKHNYEIFKDVLAKIK